MSDPTPVDARSEIVVTTLEEHIVNVEMVRPPENYIDVDIANALADALEQVESDPSVRVIVLTTRGKHYCAGARLTVDGDAIPRGDVNPLYAAVVRLFRGEVPIITEVQGAAIGAGLGLALSADFRVACPEARFAASFARLGFHQGFGLSVTLPRIVGPQHSSNMLFTGRRVNGPEALEMGLVDRLVAADQMRATTMELAREIAGSAPLAVRAIRATLRGDLAERVEAATNLEHSKQKVLRDTDDYREGVTATAERRPPVFLGR